MHQNKRSNRAIDFIRENALVLEIDSRPVITSKGEQFLNEVRESAKRSNSGLSGRAIPEDPRPDYGDLSSNSQPSSRIRQPVGSTRYMGHMNSDTLGENVDSGQ